MDAKIKIRISLGEITVMGPGKAQLLEAIKACGSISQAAKTMKMSYRRAWELVNVMNECFKSPLVITTHGGAHGGGAQISDLGMEILKSHRNMELKITQAASKELNTILSSLSES